ncbi:hypothetical protein K438DRAFT_96642 [Mycena galopus ATCC 62051]|nr:hypothetical protein K438DRAFT_96642 [Mycena galopus ATCC 62051]
MIPLGDIDLQHEIERHRSSGTPPLDSDTGVVVLQPEGGRERQLLSSSRTLSPADNDTGVVDLQRERGQLHRSSRTLSPSANDTGVVVRRVYSARVLGNTSVTVAVYQGDGAEEAWQQEVVKYQSIRHPNIIQIFGVASLGGVHAILFWDGAASSKMCCPHLYT